MKNFLIIFFLAVLQFKTASASQIIDVKFVTDKTLKQNLMVLENAEKIYQAKLSVEEARLGLLPKLNLWTMGKVIIDPSSFLDVAQDIVPFLVPANWFRMNQSEKLYEAEKFGLISLKANEVYQARELFYKISLDNYLYKNLASIEGELQALYSLAEDRYDLGLESVEFVRSIRIRHLKILEDLQRIKTLVEMEENTLKSVLGISLDEKTELAMIDLDLSLKPVETASLEENVLKKSPELAQMNKIIEIIPSLKNEVRFSILGVPSISRGTAGGIFDDLPASTGLGFSTSKQLALVGSKETSLKLQKQGIEVLLKRDLKLLGINFNSNVELLQNQKLMLSLSVENFNSYKDKLAMGGKVSLSDIIDNLNDLTQLMALSAGTMNDLYAQSDKLERLNFSGDYQEILTSTQDSQTPTEPQKICKKTIFGKVKCK